MSYREPTSNEPSLGNCVDISPSGMFIETTRPAARGVLVRFECVTPDAQGVVRGTARVMWLRPHNDAQGKAGMGVRFVRLEPGSARVIEELIAAAGARSSKIPSEGPQARATSEEPAVVLTAERTIGPTNRSSSVPPKGLRAPTLRGMVPADVRSIGSDAPKAAEAVQVSAPAQVSQAEALRDSARAAASDASSALRDRIDRNKKESGPPAQASVQPGAQPSKPARNPAAATLFGNSSPVPAPQPMQPAEAAQHAAAADRTTAPDGSVVASASARAAASANNKGATVHDLSPPPPPGMSSPARPRPASDHALGVPSPPPPPWKSRQSERPPEPGGVEVIRTVTVSTEPRGDGRPDYAKQPYYAQPAEPTRPQSPPRPAPTVVELPGAEDAHAPPWQPIVEPVRPAMRPERGAPPEISLPYALPDDIDGTQTARQGRNWTGWLVVGSGILVTLGLALVFGRAPAGIPGGAAAIKTDAPSAVDVFVAPKPEAAPPPVVETVPTQVVLLAQVEPPGAKVTVLGETITSPGRFAFEIDKVRFPLRVRAEMPGFGATELVLPRQIFTASGTALTHELELSLQPVEGAAPALASAAEPAAARSRERRRSPAAATEAPTATPAASSSMTSTPPPGSELTVTPAPPEPAAPASSAETPLARALECLSRGDNACVLSALEGTSGPRELDLQIETHRATGNVAAAESLMRRYIELHPEGKRAPQYRRSLGIADPAPDAP